jgi:hypothetical protein
MTHGGVFIAVTFFPVKRDAVRFLFEKHTDGRDLLT